MVTYEFGTVFRNGKRDPPETSLNTIIPAIDEFRVKGIFIRSVIYKLWRRTGSSGGINMHLPGVRVFLEQHHDSRGNFVGIFFHILRRDGEQDLVVGKGIGVQFARCRVIVHIFRNSRHAPVPCGNGAVGIPRPFGAKGGEIFFQPLGFFDGYLGLDRHGSPNYKSCQQHGQ